jgi:Resolvase, N terminal domain
VGHGLSLEAQQAKLTAYAAVYELALVAIEVDVGVSAKTLQRPALQQALGALKAGKAEVLLVVKLDHLTRSVRDLGALVETYCLAGIWRKACPILPDPESPNRSPSPSLEAPSATPNAPVPTPYPLNVSLGSIMWAPVQCMWAGGPGENR